MIAFSSKEEDEKDNKEPKVFLIKYITVSIKKGAKTCSYKALRMSCRDIISRSSFISIIGTG